ncbi:cytochrome P450 20A1-like [Tubulanus polymorphus]|uniref:cytochrome P450 20A1-like n=1 Tax=Tubulanus polymorphus TaxID=672921 RepID=UPI003DA33B4E
MAYLFISILAAIVGAVTLLYTSIQKLWKRHRLPPGLKPSHKKYGNLPDIQNAGSIHEFLLSNHKKFGAIFSFWFGEKLVCSIASSDLFQEQIPGYDRPREIYGFMEILFGRNMLVNVNGIEAQRRRAAYDRCFNQESVNNSLYIINKNVAEAARSLIGSAGRPVSVTSIINPTVFKTMSMALFGADFLSDEQIHDFNETYKKIFEDIQIWMQHPSLMPPPESLHYQNFQLACKKLRKIVDSIVVHRTSSHHNTSLSSSSSSSSCDHHRDHRRLLIDQLIVTCSKTETVYDEALNFLISSISTSSNTIAFSLFYLAKYPEIQGKAYNSIIDNIQQDPVTPHNIDSLSYIKWIVEETLRCACVVPFCGRYNAKNTLGGYSIPEKTPLFYALGSSFKHGDVWPSPDEYDPTRFCPALSAKRPKLSFSPFGFGKRMCPGYRLAMANMITFLTVILRTFKLELSENADDIRPEYGFVTHPNQDILCYFIPRDENLRNHNEFL